MRSCPVSQLQRCSRFCIVTHICMRVALCVCAALLCSQPSSSTHPTSWLEGGSAGCRYPRALATHNDAPVGGASSLARCGLEGMWLSQESCMCVDGYTSLGQLGGITAADNSSKVRTPANSHAGPSCRGKLAAHKHVHEHENDCMFTRLHYAHGCEVQGVSSRCPCA